MWEGIGQSQESAEDRGGRIPNLKGHETVDERLETLIIPPRSCLPAEPALFLAVWNWCLQFYVCGIIIGKEICRVIFGEVAVDSLFPETDSLQFDRVSLEHKTIAGVAQLVEHHVANVIVEGSSPFTRSFLLPPGPIKPVEAGHQQFWETENEF